MIWWNVARNIFSVFFLLKGLARCLYDLFLFGMNGNNGLAVAANQFLHRFRTAASIPFLVKLQSRHSETQESTVSVLSPHRYCRNWLRGRQHQFCKIFWRQCSYLFLRTFYAFKIFTAPYLAINKRSHATCLQPLLLSVYKIRPLCVQFRRSLKWNCPFEYPWETVFADSVDYW